ncbi:hypothetical protein PSY52_23145, partial [Shigella flexneri]|nr:hypothetical protein [Shigella flexneri]
TKHKMTATICLQKVNGLKTIHFLQTYGCRQNQTLNDCNHMSAKSEWFKNYLLFADIWLQSFNV